MEFFGRERRAYEKLRSSAPKSGRSVMYASMPKANLAKIRAFTFVVRTDRSTSAHTISLSSYKWLRGSTTRPGRIICA